MATDTLKILWCLHHKFLMHVWPFFINMHERVNWYVYYDINLIIQKAVE